MSTRIGVSRLISRFCVEFDRMGKSAKVAERRGITQAEVLSEWEAKRQQSMADGKRFHAIAQALMGDLASHTRALSDGSRHEHSTHPQGSVARQIFNLMCDLEGVVGQMDGVYPELSVRSSWPLATLQGKIDAVLHQGGRALAIDWKFGDLASREWDQYLPPFDHIGQSKLTNALLQVALYSVILEHEGRPCLRPRIYHITGESVQVYETPDHLIEMARAIVDMVCVQGDARLGTLSKV